MTAINLLPWRQTQRDLVKRRFLIYLAAAITAALVALMLVNAVLNHKINQVNKENLLLAQALDRFEHLRRKQ